MKKICILGAGGFIGSHLVKKLIRTSEFNITCVDITKQKIEKIAGSKGFNFVNLDIRKSGDDFESLIKESDIVIDLIAYANPDLYIKIPLKVVELNLFENLKVADYCEKYNKWLIQFSTCEVYGKSDGSTNPLNPDTSDCILGPIRNQRWIYSCAKQLLERMLYAKGVYNNLQYTIIRPFNFVGPEMDFLVEDNSKDIPRVFPGFISSLLKGFSMKIVDMGENYRTWTYIDDAIDAIYLILKNEKQVRNEILNIGSYGNEIKVYELAILMKEIFEQITNKKIYECIEFVDGEKFYGKGYEDCDRRIPDTFKLNELGWKANYNLYDTMHTTINYYVKNYS